MLDNKLRVETPESIALDITPAGPLPRILAYSCDLTIRLVIIIFFSSVLSIFDEFGYGLYLIFYFILDWFYCVLFEMFNKGMTPGKQAFNIQVVHDDGTPLSWNASILRNLIRIVDYFPSFYIIGLTSMCYSKGFKRLGDHAAGTLVAYTNQPPVTPEITQTGSRPMPFAMEMEEQQAILAFAERSKRLSLSRQIELATILTDIIPMPVNSKQNQDKTQVSELKKIANGIIGQKDTIQQKPPAEPQDKEQVEQQREDSSK